MQNKHLSKDISILVNFYSDFHHVEVYKNEGVKSGVWGREIESKMEAMEEKGS